MTMEMRDRLIELLNQLFDYHITDPYEIPDVNDFADDLLANGVIVPPCKVGDVVYVVEPLVYDIYRNDECDCKNCAFFYEGGYGDNPDCTSDRPCYHIVEKIATLRDIGNWIEPNLFTNKIAWGKTVFLTKEEAEAKLKERDLSSYGEANMDGKDGAE